MPAAVRGEWAVECDTSAWGFAQLVWSDYETTLLIKASREPLWISRLLYPLRLAFNPSLQLALLVRIAQKGPRLLQHPVRWLQIVMFGSEIFWFRRQQPIEIGPGVMFPHPTTVLIGAGTRIGAGVTIYNNTTLGGDRHPDGTHPLRTPVIGDRAVIYGYASILGAWRIGQDSVVGTRVWIDEDVPPGALKTIKGLRLEGQWPGESRLRWRPGAGLERP